MYIHLLNAYDTCLHKHIHHIIGPSLDGGATPPPPPPPPPPIIYIYIYI